jgi:hypothetical protein
MIPLDDNLTVVLLGSWHNIHTIDLFERWPAPEPRGIDLTTFAGYAAEVVALSSGSYLASGELSRTWIADSLRRDLQKDDVAPVEREGMVYEVSASSSEGTVWLDLTVTSKNRPIGLGSHDKQ